MPELPEVEAFRRLAATLENATITEVNLPSPTAPRKFVSESEAQSLLNCKILSVRRKGKLLSVDLSSNKRLFIHMGMTGRISTPTTVPKLESLTDSDYPPPHTHLTIKANSKEFSFSDPRRFGYALLYESDDESPFDELADDGLSFDDDSEAVNLALDGEYSTYLHELDGQLRVAFKAPRESAAL